MSTGELDVRRAGDRALLLIPQDADALDLLSGRLRDAPPDGVCDLAPAAETILVTTDPGADLGRIERDVRALFATDAVQESAGDGEVVDITVRYDGPDLADVAALLGMTPDDVVATHTGRLWRCRFVGFTAGFGYLRPDEPALVVPRRDSPRTRVPVGAVGLADGYSAVYPSASPGGWQLIGSTTDVLWDLNRPRPALLAPGTAVRFVEVGAR